jgi:hypothetical protein
MGGGQTGAPADDDHVPCHDPWRGHRDLAFHGAGRPVWAGPDPGTGAFAIDGRRLRPARPLARVAACQCAGWDARRVRGHAKLVTRT